MRCAGIDIGSRTVKVVVMEDGRVAGREIADTSARPLDVAAALLRRHPAERVVATGYGRELLEVEMGVRTITEIRAHAVGVRHALPGVETIVDIGGQDVKVVTLDQAGKVRRFEMNDRCAAGTGRFLEVMAGRLGFAMDGFGAAALAGRDGIRINATCTVFAESEVVGLVSRGADRRDIARALHVAVVSRIVSMYGRVCEGVGRVALSGGGALNPALRALLAEAIGAVVVVPDDPQTTGVLGAALVAAETPCE